MIKSELIKQIANQLMDIPEKKIAESVNHLIELMANELHQGRRIEIRGFGSFSLHHRPPRNAHNPKTGEKVLTEEKYSPHFKPGKALKERVDASRAQHPIKDDE